MEEHPQIFLCFGLCNVAKYLLFCLLRNVCAVQTTDLDEFSIGMVLTEKLSCPVSRLKTVFGGVNLPYIPKG